MTQPTTGSIRRTLVIIALVTSAAGVTSCGSGEPSAPAPSGGSSAAASTAATSPSASPSASASSSSPPPPVGSAGPPPPATSESFVPSSARAGGTVSRLRGTLEAGVESGCVVLTDDSGAVLANLIGVDTTTTPLGTSVVVTGKFEHDLMTTCQQGKPFTVASVELP